MVVERLRVGQTGLNNEAIKFYQVKEVALDIKVWLIALCMASA